MIQALHFLNTRPVERAGKLTQELAACGVLVKDMPLLSIKPLPISDDDKAALADIANYAVVVCVSPSAANLAAACLLSNKASSQVSNKVSSQAVNQKISQAAQQKQALHRPNWVAVGSATQQALSLHGILANTPVTMNNEGMLLLPEIASLTQADKVLILRGKGGRRLLVNELQKKGVTVHSIAFYERQRPENLAKQFAGIRQWARVVLISSGEAWQHWCSVCEQVQQYQYVVLGERIADMVASLGCQYVLVNDLSSQCIYEALVHVSDLNQ